MNSIKELEQKDDAITEIGLLDLILRNHHPDDMLMNEHRVLFESFEPEKVFISYNLYKEECNREDYVTLMTEGIQVTEFIKLFALKTYADLERITQTELWDRFFLKGKAALHFDDLVHFDEVYYTVDGKWQCHEDLRAYLFSIEQ